MAAVLPHGSLYSFFFFNDTATTEIYTLSLHDALPISIRTGARPQGDGAGGGRLSDVRVQHDAGLHVGERREWVHARPRDRGIPALPREYPDTGQRERLRRQRGQLSQMAGRHAPVR